jgi:POT family proton-dependent oligopeptide transporter
VKFGAIIMAIGYFTLCFGGEAAKPTATIDGTKYNVTLKGDGKDRKQYVTLDSQELRIRGNEDKTISLLDSGEKEVKKLDSKQFESSGERSPLHVAILLIGLSMVTVGNGFFKPNISTIVGSLYPPGDRRRDAGFTIFYMGINLGSFLSQVLCPFVATAIGWWAGFGLAALGMVLSWSLISFDGGRLNGYGERPANAPTNKDFIIYIAAILMVPVFYLLFVNLMEYKAPAAESGIVGYVLSLPLMGKLLFSTFLIGVPAILAWSFMNGNTKEFQMMVAAMVLIVFNVVFWTLFEQAGSSLTLFAERNTDLSFFGLFSISAGQTQFFNALFIVLFAPVFSILWSNLAKKGLEPSIPIKFGIAIMGVGLGFLFLVFGAKFANAEYKVTIWWLAGLYLIHSIAELCISPVGLSMITKLSIVRIVGLMMGVWFLSTSVAQYVAGIVAQVASVETVGGEVTNMKVSLETYVGVFEKIGLISIGIGVVLLILSWPLKKFMHGVK